MKIMAIDKRSKASRLAAGLLTISLMAAAMAASVAAVEESSPIFIERIDIRSVDVEVVVKKGGERVTGLASEDFRISLDGEPISIDNFAEITAGATSAGPVTTRYLVFIDDDFSIPTHRNNVLRRFEDQLDQLDEQDRMAVVAWDGSQVELLSSWQSPGEPLREVFERAQDRPAYGLKRQSEWGRLQSALNYRDRLPGTGRSFSSIGFSGSTRPGAFSPRSAAQLRSRVSHLSSALASAMRGFAQPPGRRVVVFLSGPLPPVESEAQSSDRLGRFPQGLEARRLFTPAVSTANRLGYTIYPVDLGGARIRDSAGVSAEVASPFEADRRRELAREDDYLSQEPLLFMAESTGGRTLRGSARLSALESVARDTRSYYRLGISPLWRGDDEEQRLRVEWLGGEGRVEVRTRRGFLDLSPSARVTMAVESAHLFDLPLPDEGRFEVGVDDVELKSRNRMLVPLTLHFPVEGFTFLAGEKGEETRLELRIAASDDRSDTAEIPVVPITIRRDETDGGFSTWQTTLELRRRSHRLLLAIHDPLGGKVLAQRLEIDPEALDQGKNSSRRGRSASDRPTSDPSSP